MLPVVFLLIFFFFWLVNHSSSRTSLITGVQRGARLAITRANTDVFGDNIAGGAGTTMADVRMFRDTGSASPAFMDLLRFPPEDGPEVDGYTDRWFFTGSAWTGGPIRNANEVYIAALAYIQGSMRASVGSTIRYPCDPVSLERDELEDQGMDPYLQRPGCLRCVFLGDQPSPPDLPLNSLSVKCFYEPDTYILRPLVGMFRVLGAWGSDKVPSLMLQSEANIVLNN